MPLRWRSRRRFDDIVAGERSLAGQERSMTTIENSQSGFKVAGRWSRAACRRSMLTVRLELIGHQPAIHQDRIFLTCRL